MLLGFVSTSSIQHLERLAGVQGEETYSQRADESEDAQ